MKTICYDFDDTIAPTEPDGVPKKPFDGIAKTFHNLKKRGLKIIVQSARWGTGDEEYNKKQMDVVRGFMYRWRIPYDGIWTGKKPRADFFVDDKGIRATENPKVSYDLIMNELNGKITDNNLKQEDKK